MKYNKEANKTGKTIDKNTLCKMTVARRKLIVC
jgi:hypothetical protein